MLYTPLDFIKYIRPSALTVQKRQGQETVVARGNLQPHADLVFAAFDVLVASVLLVAKGALVYLFLIIQTRLNKGIII